jgi:hypothetical protein
MQMGVKDFFSQGEGVVQQFSCRSNFRREFAVHLLNHFNIECHCLEILIYRMLIQFDRANVEGFEKSPKLI